MLTVVLVPSLSLMLMSCFCTIFTDVCRWKAAWFLHIRGSIKTWSVWHSLSHHDTSVVPFIKRACTSEFHAQNSAQGQGKHHSWVSSGAPSPPSPPLDCAVC